MFKPDYYRFYYEAGGPIIISPDKKFKCVGFLGIINVITSMKIYIDDINEIGYTK